jgi:Ricin-type beta-trefoil lectin domain
VWAMIGHHSAHPADPVAVNSPAPTVDDSDLAVPLDASDSAAPSDDPSTDPSAPASTAPAGPRPAATTKRPAPAPPAPTGDIRSAAGGCLDVAGGHQTNGTRLMAYQCHVPTTSNQTWTVAADGTIRALGKCMKIGADGVSAGAPIVLWDCDGAASEVWRVGPSQSLANPGSQKCLRDTDGNANSYLELAPCSGASDQKWTLPR